MHTHAPLDAHVPLRKRSCSIPAKCLTVLLYLPSAPSASCALSISSLERCYPPGSFQRSFQGNDPQFCIDSIDQVNCESSIPRLNNLRHSTQVLARSCLDEKVRRRSLLLLSKIPKTHVIISTSYILQRDLMCVGRVFHNAGFTEASSGECLGSSVAIKRLKVN